MTGLKVIKYVLKMTCALIVILPMLLLLIGAFAMGIHQSWGLIIFAALVIALAVFSMFRSTKTFRYKPKQLDLYSISPVLTPGLILRPGEICWLSEPVKVGHTKEVTTGYAGRSSGISVRVAKGVTLHTGGSRGVPVKRTVMEKFDGTLYITSQRIVLASSKYGFNQPLRALTHITPYRNALELQFGNKACLIFLKEPLYASQVLHEVVSGQLESIYLARINSSAYENAGPQPESFTPIPKSEQVEMEKLNNMLTGPLVPNLFEIKTEHIDPDENIPTPADAKITYLDACALNFWNGRQTDFQVPQYYKNTAFGRNVGPALDRLVSNGYLKCGDIRKNISLKLVPELKAILSEKELKVSGRKAELVQRLIDNVPLDELEEIFPVGIYEITEAGKEAQQPYTPIFESQKHGMGISKYRLIQEKEQNPTETDEEILTRLINKDLAEALHNNRRDEYQRLTYSIAGYLNDNNKLEESLKYYCIYYFLWILSTKEYISGDGGKLNQNQTEYISEIALILGMPLDKVIHFFISTIKSENVFGLATDENLDCALHYFRAGLGDNRS